MKRAPDLLRDSCPVGYYCPQGTDYPIACPAGTYNGIYGQSALSDCSNTPAGYYSVSNSTTPNGQCLPGFYCPLGSSTPRQIPCPPRYYLPFSGGASLEDCSLCIPGYYCPKGTAHPIICPKGFYCVAGILNPMPCKPGTYSNLLGLARSDQCTFCDGGTYCNGYALTAPSGSCEKGNT
jgi:hypothetical protein